MHEPGGRRQDRTPGDPPVEWVLELEVHPPGLESAGPARERQDAIAAAAVTALREAGYGGVESSTAELDAGLADIDAQAQGQTGEVGWTTSHSLAYQVSASAVASTREQVTARAVQVAADAVEREVGAPVWRHTTDEPVFLAWGVSAEARPR